MMKSDLKKLAAPSSFDAFTGALCFEFEQDFVESCLLRDNSIWAVRALFARLNFLVKQLSSVCERRDAMRFAFPDARH